MTPGEHWLATLWPLVRAHLPAPPARVVDIGCGPHGGFVPFLHSNGYDAAGVDPKAPDIADYHRIEFEHLELPGRVDALIASTSLHHVTDPAEVIDRLTTTLRSDGTLVVFEWAWEKFDEATAHWCFQRLGPNDEENWLHRRRDEWTTSGQEWGTYLEDWARRERLHRGEALLRLLDERFERRLLTFGPYFFPDLADTTDADEQAAIAAGLIRATRIDWVGGRR
jgi:SAM-dependent methyltransferase